MLDTTTPGAVTFQEHEEENGINLKEFFYLIVDNWYWFLISLLLTFGLGIYYILKTQPTYEQEMQILVKKDENSSSLSAQFGQFSSIGGHGVGNENMQNVIYMLKSPAYMEDVVRHLKLDVNYSIEGTFHNHILYGSLLPIMVTFSSVPDDETAAVTVELLEGGDKVMLSDFSLNDSIIESKPLIAKLSSVVSTPVGKLMVRPTKYYVGAYSKPIHVRKALFLPTVQSYAGRVNVELVHDWASVFKVKMLDSSPQRAADVLTEIFNVYNERWINDINERAINTAKFIDEELNVIQSELGNVDADISTYKSQNLVPNVETASNIYMHKAEATSTQLLELSNQLYMARYIKKQLGDGTKYSVLPGNNGIENATVGRLIASYNEMVLQRNTLVANSSSANPLVKDLDDQLNATKQAIAGSLDNVIAAVSSQIANLKGSESQTKGQIAATPAQAKYLLSVERQQKVKEQLYVFLLQKREETQLSKAYSNSNSRMLAAPLGGGNKVSPRKINVMLVCLVLGILIPLVLLLLRRTIDTAVYSRKDIDSLTQPFVGEIPLSYRKRKGIMGLLTNRRKDVREIVVQEKSGNVINEAFRVVRTNLEFVLGREGSCRTMMFTSANAGSGKTFISMNLALSFAIKGKRVLAIDMDLRKASLSTYVASPTIGISNYLSEHIDDVEKIVLRGKLNDNLDVIPVGTIPPNPTELLFSERLEQLIEKMKGEYDYIFIDCPPIDIVADSAIINKFVDLTVFVIRAGLFDKSMLPDVERNYTEKRFKNMVTILNGVYDTGHSGYYGYGYGYGYGYTTEK